MSETIKDLIKLSELLKHVDKAYYWANSAEKEELIRIIFSELYVFGETLTFKGKNGFEALENRFNVVGCPTTWLSELGRRKYAIRESAEQLEKLLKHIRERSDSEK